MKISPGVLSFVLLPQAVAFSMAPAFGRRISIPYSALFQLPENYERAVDCAEDYGECKVEELVDLVNELEQVEECFLDQDEETCDDEASDRFDVADALRQQHDQRLTQENLRDPNLRDPNSFTQELPVELGEQEFFEPIQEGPTW